jgi:hypothetical protein
MLVRPLVGWLVHPHITSKTDYVASPSRLGFSDPLVFLSISESVVFLCTETQNLLIWGLIQINVMNHLIGSNAALWVAIAGPAVRPVQG